jgi:hypothetical protein
VTSPPLPAVPGTPYVVNFTFTDYQSGALVDPITVQLDLTFGSSIDLGGTEVAGPFVYTGASAAAANTIWRTGEGAYSFMWGNVPADALTGAYVANWTTTYGPDGDTFLALEDFAITSGGPFVAVPSGDIGYWTGSLTYGAFSIEFGAVDANGIAWTWQSITGWDSPPTAGQVIQRSADQGGWPAAQFYGPRVLTLTIMASAPTQALRDIARGLLQQVVPVNDLATLVYDEPVPKQVYVRRNASASVGETYPTFCDVVFTIAMVAPDPRKYSVQPVIDQIIMPVPVINPLSLPFTTPVFYPGGVPPEATSITAVNDGTYETRPTLTLTGPCLGPSVVNATTGQAITFTGLSLASSDVLVIDTDNRQSTLNGVFYAADIGSQWWTLAAGQTQVYLNAFQSPGGATLTLNYSPAWI